MTALKLNFRVSDGRVQFLNSDATVRSTRPATEQELQLWQGLMGLVNEVESLRKASDERAGWLYNEKKRSELLEAQINRLAEFIMTEVPGEPSQSEGACDTAIRLLKRWKNGPGPVYAESIVFHDAHQASDSFGTPKHLLGTRRIKDDPQA